ncbi:glycosyltransferase [Microbacterium stercoris]|uniref:Glycosyltransferase n=1 Tax=Microbacterium stercoris TaxID=2820289 RepID=A0A939QMI3_9MICO|nr:glycosyltransferase [Microbacterium stercoris]MBO3664970.1 glycosyltransferase [Microbacterium stercoris]
MTVTLRVVLDQLVAPDDADLAEASRELVAALHETAPEGCVVEELVAARPREMAPGGMVHSPTLRAPLARRGREATGDQTAVTVWDLRPWEAPGELPHVQVADARKRLRRAAKRADAVVVPTHAMAERLRGLARLDDRVRVIAGAHPGGFGAPTDAAARHRDLGLPARFVALVGGEDGLPAGLAAAAPTGLDVVILDVRPETAQAARTRAISAGFDPARVHPLASLDRGDRATVLSEAVLCLAPSGHSAWPWRALEAMALGTPLVALDSEVHREVVLDGGLVVAADELTAAVAETASGGRDAARLRVLGRDRSRAFSWAGAAERVWQLHADL